MDQYSIAWSDGIRSCKFIMDMPGIRTLLLSTVSLWLVFPAAVIVHSDPIIVDYNYCATASFVGHEEVECCPSAPTEETTIIEGLPAPMTKSLRVRRAAQCTDEAYAEKLNLAYALMRALPHDDPRSMYQQTRVHCAYCGAAFYHNDTGGNTPGIDIHFSWLTNPWHRLYLYFHERILASLLGDPTFSLSFWNWDAADVGHNFPTAYANSNGAAYDANRSTGAKGFDRIKFPDLTYSPLVPLEAQTLVNASEETLVKSNLGVMKAAMITGASTTEIFMGRAYRAGQTRGSVVRDGGGGTLESTAHVAVHFWTGQSFPLLFDMGPIFASARDPVFFSHHSNVDRLWEVWKNINESHKDFTDPDWLNTQFQFFDENKVLRKVNVSDSLDITKLGYVYEEVDYSAWRDFEPTRCTNLSYSDTIVQAKLLPAPVPDSTGSYHFTDGQAFIFLTTQPASNDSELFLYIIGIKTAGMLTTGFDVYLNWLNPLERPESASCSEYVGRFTNVAAPSGRMGTAPAADMGSAFQQSISVPLERTGVPQPGPSEVVVVLAPTSTTAANAITFFDIIISPAPIPLPFSLDYAIL